MRRFLYNLYKKRSTYIFMMGFYMFQWNLYVYHGKLDDSPFSMDINEHQKSLHLDHFNFFFYLNELFTSEMINTMSSYSYKPSSLNVTSSTIFHLNNILSKNNVYLLDIGVLIELNKELGNTIETESLLIADFLKYKEYSLVTYGINIQDSINFLEDLKSIKNFSCYIIPVFTEYFTIKILASIYVKCGLLTVQVVTVYKRGTFLWIPKDEYQIDGLLKLFSDKPRALNKFETVEVIDREFQTIRIPKVIDKFLFDFKYSEFVECSLAKPLGNYSGDFGSKYQFDKNSEIGISQKLVYVKSVLESFHNYYTISGSILNGWMKNCEINPSATEIDLVLNGYDFDPQILRHFKHDKKLPFTKINFDNQTLQIKLTKLDDISLTLSFSYEYNKTHRWLKQKIGDQVVKRFVDNFEPVCSAELMSAKILVPCEPIKYLEKPSITEKPLLIQRLVNNNN